MVELSAIDAVIAVIGSMEATDKLYERVRHAFTGSFVNQSVEYELQPAIAPDPELIREMESRVKLLCEKSQAKLKGTLRYSLLEGTKNNESIPELRRRVKEVYDGTDYEIELIARNEVLDASKTGRQHAFEKSGVKYKRWKTVMSSNRTCDLCKRMDGQVVAIDEFFVDPLTGNKFFTTHAHPMCRCAEIPMMRPTEPVPKRRKTRAPVEVPIEPITHIPIKEMRLVGTRPK